MAKANNVEKRRGPKPKGPYEDKRRTLTTRITETTRAKLEEAANSSGRSLSQEIEFRLGRSFMFEDSLAVTGTDKETAQFVRNLLDAKQLIQQRRGEDAWTDFETWLALKSALDITLEMERPEESLIFIKQMEQYILDRERVHNEWREAGGKDGLLASYLDPDAPPQPEYPLSPKQKAINLGRAVAGVIIKERIEVLTNHVQELDNEVRRQEATEFMSNNPEFFSEEDDDGHQVYPPHP
jgi:hypothetical protein